jgi:hypothetical protein
MLASGALVRWAIFPSVDCPYFPQVQHCDLAEVWPLHFCSLLLAACCPLLLRYICISLLPTEVAANMAFATAALRSVAEAQVEGGSGVRTCMWRSRLPPAIACTTLAH